MNRHKHFLKKAHKVKHKHPVEKIFATYSLLTTIDVFSLSCESKMSEREEITNITWLSSCEQKNNISNVCWYQCCENLDTFAPKFEWKWRKKTLIFHIFKTFIFSFHFCEIKQGLKVIIFICKREMREVLLGVLFPIKKELQTEARHSSKHC